MKRKFILLPITLTALTPAISLVACGEKGHDYSNDYLTFMALSDGYFECDIYENISKPVPITLDLWYSINGEQWKIVDHNYENEKTFEYKYYYHKNDVIRFKGENEYFSHRGKSDDDWWTSLHFGSLVNASGNIMSLLYGDNFIGKTDLKCEGVFGSLFENKVAGLNFAQISNAKDLILPATNLTNMCYQNMFCDCYALTIPPQLPATTLASSCYDCMFCNCNSLGWAPYLPALDLVSSCYSSMFENCVLLRVEEQSNNDNVIFTCPNIIPSRAVYHMFNGTGGSVQTDPIANHTYYWVK